MGLDLFFKEDVARILASTYETMQAAQAATVRNEEYQQGFGDAIRAVSVAFGLRAPSQVLPPPRNANSPPARVICEDGHWRR